MGDAQFVKAVFFGQVSHDINLGRCGVARNAANRFQADVDDGIASLLVRLYILIEPDGKIGISAVGFYVRRIICRRREKGSYAVQLSQRRVNAECFDMRKFRCDLTAICVRTDFMDQDLDPRFVDIVPPSVAVVHAQTRLKIAQQIARFHKGIDLRRDHRRPAHAAADKHPRAQCAILADQLKPDVV